MAIGALRNWHGHRNAARRHSQLIPMLLVIATIIGCMSIDAIVPTAAYASTTTATADMYQLYDTRKRTEQVNVNKIWDDGLNPEDREYKNGKQSQDYTDLLAITVQTGVSQTTLRTYTITYDANVFPKLNRIASFGNRVYLPSASEVSRSLWRGSSAARWACRSTSSIRAGSPLPAARPSPDTSITLTNTVTDKWMNTRADGSTTTLYAVWKDIHINYAVMAYGIGVDKDASGNTLGITFGPAIGYPEFSPYNGTYTADTSSTQTFTKSHSVSGDTTIMSESAAACTDASHSVITGTDAGTDAAGNAYRCLHYDNWNTIIYWNKTDPHVYDKCIPNHCSKTVTIMPSTGTIANGIFSTSMSDSARGLTGDGQSYVVESKWDNWSWGNWSNDVDITQAGQGYAASLIRARLVGADSHTKLDDRYAGSDALTRYTSESSILSCFPENLRDAVTAKALSGVSAASSGSDMSYDVVSNDGVADKLWLFSYGEMTDAVYPSVGFRSDDSYDAKRSTLGSSWWLRSPWAD